MLIDQSISRANSEIAILINRIKSFNLGKVALSYLHVVLLLHHAYLRLLLVVLPWIRIYYERKRLSYRMKMSVTTYDMCFSEQVYSADEQSS